ncbi:MAG: hypothetical protein H7Y38_15675 [Armatimonadetes bacterium]|nr:hypothetical protein [Armatimonadota bacterium]
MKPLFEDTDPHIEEMLLARIRAMTPQKRFARIGDMNRTLDRLVHAEVRRHPDATAHEVRIRVAPNLRRPDAPRLRSEC